VDAAAAWDRSLFAWLARWARGERRAGR